MPNDLVTRERIGEACRRYSVEFRGLRCPTDRCPGPVGIKAVRVSSDVDRQFASLRALPQIGRVPVRHHFECDYECQLCGCWGSYYVPVKDPIVKDDGEMIAYSIEARGPQYLDDLAY